MQDLQKEFGADQNVLVRIAGPDLERWVLKTLCGLIASGQVRKPGTIGLREVPERFLKVLFQNESLAAPNGLYITENYLRPNDTNFSLGRQFWMTPYGREGVVGGCDVGIAGIPFRLVLNAEPEPLSSILHPAFLSFRTTSREVRFEMHWSDDGKGVVFQLGERLERENVMVRSDAQTMRGRIEQDIAKDRAAGIKRGKR